MDFHEYNRQWSYADVLISQGKYQQAESILERLMATDLNDYEVIRLMAVSKMGLRKFDQADEMCQILIARQPNDAFIYYLLANIRATERKFDECHRHLDTSIQIDPVNATYHAFKAEIFLNQKNFSKALETADTALALDAENIDALNARASALVGLDRSKEAFETIDRSLFNDPNNADTHANMGWSLLHKGDVNQALTHFKTSLKENPLNEFAKAGMLEAMKAKFPVYRYFLMIMLRLGKMQDKNQWAIIFGIFILYRILWTAFDNVEWLQPFILPLIAVVFLFVMSSWIFSPLMNLYLLSNPYGRVTLTDAKIKSAKLVGVALIVAAVCLIIYILGFKNNGILYVSLLAFLMLIPLGTMLNPFFEHNRKKLVWVTCAMAVVLIVDGFNAIMNNTFGSSFSMFFAIMLLGYQFYANYVMMQE
jgi:tetratricopeptide (TPR) repeat protein